MMNRITLFPALVVLALGSPLISRSNCAAGDLMSPQTAAQLGLEVAWLRQMRVPAGAGSIIDQQIIAHQENPREFVEVATKPEKEEEAEVVFRIPTDQVGSDGQQIGKEEAERLARREVRRLTRRLGELEITSKTTPRVHLYTASDNGTIDCRDAETGTPIWMTHVGNARLGFGKMGIDDKFITITNGGNLIKIDVTNGEPINTVRTTSMPMYGAIHAGDFSLVPTIRNGVEGYPLADTTVDPFMEIVSGLALEPPTKSPSSSKIAWATDRGFVYVMELSGEPNVQFRLNTDGIVSGRIASAEGDRFFFASESGQVYGLRATRTGRVLWSRPYGEPFYSAPFLQDNLMLLPSTYGTLFAIDMETGMPRWEEAVANVDQILGAVGNHVFVRLLSHSFAAIDMETGKVVMIDDALKPEKLLVNRTTDRLYFVNAQGTVQCMRPIGGDLPSIKRSVDPGEEEETPAEEQPGAITPSGPTTDPFGAPADPFGVPAGDPFGSGPAAGGGAMEDPFAAPAGGNDDPFGGDPFGN